MKRAAVAVAALALLAPSSAGAVTVEEDLEVAERYWNTAPAMCASISVSYGDTLVGNNGEATQPTRPGTECVMRIKAGLSVLIQCEAVIHEYGHWLGLGHSPDPTSPMAERRRGLTRLCFNQWARIHAPYCSTLPLHRKRLCWGVLQLEREEVY